MVSLLKEYEITNSYENLNFETDTIDTELNLIITA